MLFNNQILFRNRKCLHRKHYFPHTKTKRVKLFSFILRMVLQKSKV